MDWFSWLSRSGLDPSLIYEYGLAFARNELQAEDMAYFDHEFLQSMGISIAKHRLEIIKLARKDAGGDRKEHQEVHQQAGFSRDSAEFKAEQLEAELARCKGQSEKELIKLEPPPPTPVLRIRRQAKSGPLDARMQENLMHANRCLKLSGPLDGKAQERLVFAYRSPKLHGPPDGRPSLMMTTRSPQVPSPLDARAISPGVHCDYSKESRGLNDDFDDQSLWSALFQDMKPT
uniref:SAM domain-containing protein n=1 Tax=Salix viminalis TaxID=40686 RepID=A0A6N2K120_SALVM